MGKYDSIANFYQADENIVISPLIELFFKKLAIAYKTNIETYRNTLQQILTHQCVVDGDKLIDEHTGYIITDQEFNIDEGYDDFGSKINTKSVLEEDDFENSESFKDSSDLISNEMNDAIKDNILANENN